MPTAREATATFLLTDARSHQILHQRAVNLAKVTSSHSEQMEATVEFSLGVERYALPLRLVAEITRRGQITPVPGSAAALIGAVFVRGEVYCVMDLATILGLAANDQEESGGYILLVWFKGKKVGLKVDEVQQIAMQTKRTAELQDPGVIGVTGSYTLGITGGRLISLDLDAVFDHPVFSSPG